MSALVVAQIALAAAQDILFATAAGLLACRVMGARTGVIAPASLRGWQAGLAIALAVTALVYLWLQAAIMSGSSLDEAGEAIGAVLTSSHYGVAWSIGFIGALLAALSRPGGRRTLPLFSAGLICWAAGKAAASHAADTGDFSVREAIHVVHLCATALWAGSVIVAAVVLHRAARGYPDAPEQSAEFCTELSYLATFALVLVLITGIYNGMGDTAQASAPLLDITWGRLLIAKLICVALAVVLGGWNRMVILPKLHAPLRKDCAGILAAQRRFNTWLSFEALAMVLVLTLAAALGHASPMGS